MYKKKIFSSIKISSYKSLLIVYSLITLLCLIILTFFISSYIERSAIDVEERESESILKYMGSYIEEKSSIAKDIYLGISLSNSKHQETLYLLEKGYNEYVKYKLERLAGSKDSLESMESYIRSCLSKDRDITGINFYPLNIDRSYVFTNTGMKVYEKDKILPQLKDKISWEPVVLPSRQIGYGIYESYENKINSAYSFAYKVTDTYSPQTRGFLVVDFSAEGILTAYNKINKDLRGGLIVCTSEGQLIFNTSEDKKKDDIIKKYMKSTGTRKEKDGIVSVLRIDSLPITMIHSIDSKTFYKSIYLNRIMLFLGVLASIVIIFLITFATTRHFSNKVELVMNGIRKIREGDLKHRIPAIDGKDEICEISSGFNELCNHIESYINRVYVLEIEQKNAQMKALQARINPHFLYNTLEVIRMKVAASGDDEAAEMIYLLGAIFRTSVKEKTIVTIRDELTIAEMYLEFFKIRYKDKLNVEFNIDENVMGFGIIKYTIQPVIENYMLYGFDIKRDDNLMSITLELINNKIYLNICDNGKGIEDKRLAEIKNNIECGKNLGEKGFGLASVNERIRLLFGSEYQLKIQSQSEIGTKIIIVMPAINKKELEKHVQGFYC